MTVVNAMRFNDKEGGMVADSQSSNSLRKYDLADKIFSHVRGDTLVLGGGSGVADILYETTQLVDGELKRHDTYTTGDVATHFAGVLSNIKRQRINHYIFSTFGVTAEQALAGRDIGPHLLNPVTEAYVGQNKDAQALFSNGFVLLGRDSLGVHLYFINMGESPYLLARPYASIGSGADESDKVLSRYVTHLKREQRLQIHFLEGMTTLIRATNASTEINQGVGGVPTIAYFCDKGIITLDEDASRFATEIVRVRDAGFLDQPIATDSLEKLLQKTTSVPDLEETVFTSHPQYHQIMRFLRGYK